MFARQLTVASAVAALIAATGAASQALTDPASVTHATAPPTHPSPSHFTLGRVDNPWFPLRPGNRLVYRGSEDGHRLRDVVRVARRTHVIDGVTCRVVRDLQFQDGVLVERTTDWYAQTRAGTVWYFGESTAELDRHGRVTSREGSFQSGRDGAQAGIFMPARPRVGDSFTQEDYPGHAEDRFTILDRSAHISVPVLASDQALLTKETTPLEPGVLDHKYYVRDIGSVREVTVRGGTESLRLVSIRNLAR